MAIIFRQKRFHFAIFNGKKFFDSVFTYKEKIYASFYQILFMSISFKVY